MHTMSHPAGDTDLLFLLLLPCPEKAHLASRPSQLPASDSVITSVNDSLF